jgi:hypothetical protein
LVCPRLHLLRSLLLPKSDLQEGVERSKDLILQGRGGRGPWSSALSALQQLHFPNGKSR